jgi:ClpP class serine protease
MSRFGHLAQRLFNVPLAIHPKKAEIVMGALAERLGIVSLENTARTPASAFFYDDDDDFGFGGPGAVVTDPGYDLVEGVALIQVSGTLVQKLGSARPFSGMTGYDGIREAFGAALADDEVLAIVLQIDSGGGEVAGCFDLVDDIYGARGQKPIAAILDENAFSAAYAIASAADPGRIYVPRTGGTGSIGVICMHVDWSEALSKAGLRVTFIHYGERKTDGHPEIPLTAEALAAFQADIDAMGDLFVQTVARNRGLDAAKVRGFEAGTFQGPAGVTAGLADKVMAPAAALQAVLAELA